jgi:peptide deformylase
MIDLMIEHHGLGLSAPQVGVTHSVFVMRQPINKNEGQAFFNPKIVSHCQDKETMDEGCLSLLGKTVSISRFKTVTVQFESVDGVTSTTLYKDIEARCIQHEMDHLDGILIFDHINSDLSRKLFLEKYQKVKRKYVRIG